MIFLAWFSLIIFVLGTVLGAYKRVYEGEDFTRWIFVLATQGSIIWCLIYLIMLL